MNNHAWHKEILTTLKIDGCHRMLITGSTKGAAIHHSSCSTYQRKREPVFRPYICKENVTVDVTISMFVASLGTLFATPNLK